MQAKQPNLDRILTHNITEIYPSKEMLQKALKQDTPLKFYIGIDPNVPDVHLGHAVVYRKLEQFRQLGHTVICLIGDFTARIGDPTDKSATRVRLTEQEVAENAKEYQRQVSKVLSFDDPENPAQLLFNSEWLSQLTFADLIELAANFTVQQMIERDMFQNRLQANKPIYLHEFFYPLMQGYDSVAMDIDVEVGGTDQTFNMLTGRELVKTLKNKEKYVITVPFLMGLDGKKMSKSTGNYISLRDEPFEVYRKVMALHDDLITHYFDMVLQKNVAELQAIKDRLESGENPILVKKELASAIVSLLFDGQAAQEAAAEFERTVQGDEVPSDIPTISASTFGPTPISLISLLTQSNLITSNSEARRLIQQGAVRVNQEKITNIDTAVDLTQDLIVQVGKGRWIRIEK